MNLFEAYDEERKQLEAKVKMLNFMFMTEHVRANTLQEELNSIDDFNAIVDASLFDMKLLKN